MPNSVGGTAWTMTEQEEHLQEIVQNTVSAAMKERIPEHGYITSFQGVIGIIVSLITVICTIALGVQKFDTLESRISKTEYQNQISIDDRRDIHNRQDRSDIIVGEVNQRLTRIETQTANISSKVDDIRAKQGR